jgi:hypothetical protein
MNATGKELHEVLINLRRLTDMVFFNKSNLLRNVLQKFPLPNDHCSKVIGSAVNTSPYELGEYARTHPYLLNPFLDLEATKGHNLKEPNVKIKSSIKRRSYQWS